MGTLRPGSVCDTTPLQRFESQSSSGEEPSTPTAASIIAAAAAAASSSTFPSTCSAQATHQATQHLHNNNNNVKIDIQLPPFVEVAGGANNGKTVKHKPPARGTAYIFGCMLRDLFLLGCIGLLMLALAWSVEPTSRGFFCSDLSLKHPYKDSTIPSWILIFGNVAVPIAVIVLVEFFRAQSKLNQVRQAHHYGQQPGSGYYLCHLELPHWLLHCYRTIVIFGYGLGLQQLTTDIAKYTIGRLRPHFVTLCQPVLPDGSSCSHATNMARYIEDFTCSAANLSEKIKKDMRLSFPSGHASFACYSMIFLVIYLQRRMHWSRLKMLRHFLQLLLLWFAFYTCLTRYSDYKHHSSDVIAGGLIGFLFAILTLQTC